VSATPDASSDLAPAAPRARHPDARMAAAVGHRNRYFTGEPCPSGHVADRYTRNGYCVDCQRELTRRNRAAVRALLLGTENGGR